MRKALVFILMFVVSCASSPSGVNKSPSSQSKKSRVPTVAEGEMLVEKGSYGEALKVFKQVAVKDPKDAKVQYYLGLCYKNLNNFNNAVIHYERTIALDDSIIDARTNLANILLEKGQTDRALSEYEKVLEKTPDDKFAHSNLAIALEMSGDFAGAMTRYEKALEIDPDFHLAWLGKGDVLVKQKKFKDALLVYENGLNKNPGNPALILKAGQSAFKNGKNQKAKAIIEKIKLSDKVTAPIATSAGILLMKNNAEDEALKMYKWVTEKFSTYADVHFPLANAFARKKEFSDAIKHYEKFISLSDDETKISKAKNRLNACKNF